ncbi:glutathione S-transferase family protein [Neptunomonas sp.]|uniref:glutathione S-transferase family protein n=1 Tax=Neptunomonas sp. TaxID=1971898 RepID=UPI003562EF02
MKLIGSGMSPYVRRIRLFLESRELLEGQDYDFINLNIYSPEGRAELASYTPAMKIPVLVDQEQKIYDSRLIHRYLNEKQRNVPLSWNQENLLTLIDAANDSFVILLLSTRSNIDTNADSLIINLQKERIERTMQLLEDSVENGEISGWDYPAICLFCLLDWVNFRDLLNLAPFPHLSSFHGARVNEAGVEASNPRNIKS